MLELLLFCHLESCDILSGKGYILCDCFFILDNSSLLCWDVDGFFMRRSKSRLNCCMGRCKRINISSSLDLLISFDVLSALSALICKYFENYYCFAMCLSPFDLIRPIKLLKLIVRPRC